MSEHSNAAELRAELSSLIEEYIAARSQEEAHHRVFLEMEIGILARWCLLPYIKLEVFTG